MADQYDFPDDARKKGLKYPNYNIFQSPSGNGWVIDDSKDAESVTFFHRSGSSIQLQPDGSMVFNTKKDRYSVVFGDDNILVTGGQNVTINGGCKLKVEGDYDLTVNGNVRQTIQGNLETAVSGDMTTAVQGQQETVVGSNQSTKVAGNMELLSNQGYFGTEGKLGIQSAGGSIIMDSSSGTDISAGGNINVKSGGNINLDKK